MKRKVKVKKIRKLVKGSKPVKKNVVKVDGRSTVDYHDDKFTDYMSGLDESDMY